MQSAIVNAAAERGLLGRWLYVLVAGSFTLIAVVGFTPNSMAILVGELPSPPIVIHLHAAVMVLWFALFLAQTILVAADRMAWHRKLGLASFVLMPAVLASMIAVTVWRYGVRVERGVSLGMSADFADVFGLNLVLAQTRQILLFAVFAAWALVMRHRDRETHKRMFILATLMPLPAAVDRIAWLPNTMPDSPNGPSAYQLLLLLPLLVYDLLRRGRLHAAYVVGLVLFIPSAIALHFLWIEA